MALYAIADTHLSQSVPKPMDVFGGTWENYTEKIKAHFSMLQPEDTLVIAGDISWAIDLDEALADFLFLEQFPCRKLLVKGNHDLWWETVTKMRRFLEQKGVKGFDFIHNNCFLYNRLALCGTRGWFFEEAFGDCHDEKVFRRELIRLEASLNAAEQMDAEEKIVFLHYPPVFGQNCCQPIIDLLVRYRVKRCYYGHLHGFSHKKAFNGIRSGIQFQLIAADFIHFTPMKIAD